MRKDVVDAIDMVEDIFRQADPEISDFVIAGWLCKPNDLLRLRGDPLPPLVCQPLVWIAMGREPRGTELLLEAARRAAAPLAW